MHTHLKVIEAKLPKTDFIRSHRGYVVGFAHIRNNNCDEILFDNGEKAYIGKHYLTAFKTGFQDYVLRYNKGTGI